MGKKMAEKPKKILVSKLFSLILPKKHCLITQNRFWPSFGILSGFLGGPQNYYFGCLSLYFDNFFARKTVGSRENPRDGLFPSVSCSWTG